jgi:hypothetical protein
MTCTIPSGWTILILEDMERQISWFRKRLWPQFASFHRQLFFRGVSLTGNASGDLNLR